MGASAARDSDSAQAELDAEIPRRMARALSGLATVSYANATQRFAPRGGSHPSSSIPAGVLDNATASDGAPLRDRSLHDFYAHQWAAAVGATRLRIVCYQAELALDEVRRGPAVLRRHLAGEDFERAVLQRVGVDALEVAVKLRSPVSLVRTIRTAAGRDADWGRR